MTIDEVIEMLNSEDCKFATSICLMRYKERDCWKCILKEYSKTVYNKAIDDFVKSEDYLMEKIKEEKAEVSIDYEWRKVVCLNDIRRMLHQGLLEIAEQLKAGGK